MWSWCMWVVRSMPCAMCGRWPQVTHMRGLGLMGTLRWWSWNALRESTIYIAWCCTAMSGTATVANDKA
jgi:hypothetical protein